jgi:glycosyltransferase involved in cell wall biosynthesis
LTHPYFLFVGTLEPRKNLLRLVHSYLLFKQRVRTDHELVLAGPKGDLPEDVMQFILAPQLADKVKWLDYVRPDEMPALYTGAEAVLYPALREGFGLPLLEAMGCGTPVICSNVGAIPEVVGDGAWLVDPSAVGEWASAMERAATEKAFLNVLRDRGRARSTLFRMENSAKQTLAALKLAAKSHA